MSGEKMIENSKHIEDATMVLEAKELLEECVKQFKSNLTVAEEEKIIDKMSKTPLINPIPYEDIKRAIYWVRYYDMCGQCEDAIEIEAFTEIEAINKAEEYRVRVLSECELAGMSYGKID